MSARYPLQTYLDVLDDRLDAARRVLAERQAARAAAEAALDAARSRSEATRITRRRWEQEWAELRTSDIVPAFSVLAARSDHLDRLTDEVAREEDRVTRREVQLAAADTAFDEARTSLGRVQDERELHQNRRLEWQENRHRDAERRADREALEIASARFVSAGPSPR